MMLRTGRLAFFSEIGEMEPLKARYGAKPLDVHDVNLQNSFSVCVNERGNATEASSAPSPMSSIKTRYA
jgi:hypothetical protein